MYVMPQMPYTLLSTLLDSKKLHVTYMYHPMQLSHLLLDAQHLLQNQFSSSGCVVKHSCLVPVNGMILAGWAQVAMLQDSKMAELLGKCFVRASLCSSIPVSSLLFVSPMQTIHHSCRGSRILYTMLDIFSIGKWVLSL